MEEFTRNQMDPHSQLDAPCSMFRSATANTPHAAPPVQDVLRDIQQGVYRRQIERLRALHADEEKYQATKRKLAGVTFSGTFAPTRAKENLKSHTGIVILDLDHLSDLAGRRTHVTSDRYTAFAFTSPGGEGLKVGVRITPVSTDAEHQAYWHAIAAYYRQTYGLPLRSNPDPVKEGIDASGKDVSRLCFVSYDPDLYTNSHAQPFPLPAPRTRPAKATPATPPPAPDGADRRRDLGKHKLAWAVQKIETSSPGYRHYWRNRASYLMGGYVAAGALDYEEAYAALTAAAQRNTTDIARATRTIQDGLEAGRQFPIPDLDDNRGFRPSHAAQAADRRRHGDSLPLSDPTADGTLPLSDYTNAVAFVQQHGDDLRYCYPWKKWLVWMGTHWHIDEAGSPLHRARETIVSLAHYAAQRVAKLAELPESDQQRTVAMVKHVKQALQTPRLQALLTQAQTDIPVQPQDLDRNPWLLNCRNGTLDLETAELLPHRREDYLTKSLPVDYDPQAACPTWQRFLWRIMGGTIEPDSPDDAAGTLENRQQADQQARELIAFLQRVVGYALTGDTREECLFLLHGTGQNGKSKFLGALHDLLGDYAHATHSKTFMLSDYSDSTSNDLARLQGTRFVSAIELGKGRRLNEELVKRVTGRDPVTARFLYGEYFDYLPTFKLFLACNDLPTIRSIDKAMWRRLYQIPFTVTIPDDEQDKQLPEKLRAELPGILAWAVRGCLAWQRDGLQPPAAVVTATAAYKNEMDVIGRFIEHCCVVMPQAQVRATRLFKAYQQWCADTGERDETQKVFGTYLTNRGFAQHKNNGVWRLGIGLLED